MLKQPVVMLNAKAGIFILNLRAFDGGTAAAIERIPLYTAGIYAWYHSFDYPDNPEAFYEKLMEDVSRKKFIDRTATVPPHLAVTIASHATFSDAKKEPLKTALQSEAFRSDLKQALAYSVLFQTPLYIGKASDLRQRIQQHMEPDSPLRLRLHSVGIDIKKCTLVFIPTAATLNSVPTELEFIYEEIFSRLFNPHFTIKYG